jgi:hypothetical protein
MTTIRVLVVAKVKKELSLHLLNVTTLAAIGCQQDCLIAEVKIGNNTGMVANRLNKI